MKIKKVAEIATTLAGSILIAVLVQVYAFGTQMWTDNFFSQITENNIIALRLVAIYSTIYLFVIFRALFGVLAINRESNRARILAGYGEKKTFSEKLRFHLSSPAYWLAMLSVVFFTLLPVEFAHNPIITAIFATTPPSVFWQKLIVLVITLPIFFPLSIWAEMAVAKRVTRDRHFFEKSKKKLINRRITIESTTIGASLFGFAVLIPVGFTWLWTLTTLSYAYLPTIAAVFLFLFAIRYVRSVRIRAKFLRRLKKLCEDRRHRISEIKRPYLSLFFPYKGFHFTLHSGGKTYSCRLMHSHTRKKHIYFNDDGTGNYVRIYYMPFMRAGFAAELFRTQKAFRYDFEADGQKILIICPIPQEVRIVREDTSFPLPMGECVSEYKVYNATTFLNCLDRDVLDR